MRRIVMLALAGCGGAAIALVAISCKKESAPAAPPPQPVPAAPADAGGALTAQNLLHRVPMRVAVSSVVANGAYSPFDLLDGDLATAWNSRTGEAKPWIAFRVPPSTHVDRVRMTVGFTGKGPEGDYFTMNPRIRKVRVWQDKVSLREVVLDPESPALQDVPIDANGGDYRIEVVETVPGSRKDWREVCVSELQVIGLPPPGMKPHDDLEITVGSLDSTPLVDPTLELTELPAYKSISAFCAKELAVKEEPCEIYESCNKPPAKPSCGDALESPPALPAGWPAGWKTARWFGSSPALRTGSCHLAIETARGETAILDHLEPHCGQPHNLDGRVGSRWEAVTQDGWFVLLTAEMSSGLPGDKRHEFTEELRVCANDSDGAPACAGPITIGKVVNESFSGPGGDGLAFRDEVVWRFRYKLAGDVLTIEKDAGKPDAENAKLLGRHRLRR